MSLATLVNPLRFPVVALVGGDFTNTLFQPRWRAWLAGAILLAVAIVIVLAIAYSGGGSGGGY